jgi:hypothetical protein
MALNILYRIDGNATIPSTTSVKGSPLSSFEIDGNFRSIKDYAEGYLDQSVKTTATPTFAGASLTSSITYDDVSRYWLSTATNWGIYWDTTNNTIEFHGSGTDRWSVDLDNGDQVMAGDLTVTGGNVYTGTTQARVKYGVWSDTNYGIGMQTGYTFGGIVNDYVMTFQMNDSSTRGFWWGDAAHTNAQGAMALTTNGKLTVAHSIRVGFGETDTTVPGATHALEVNGSLAATSKSFLIDHPTKSGMKLRYGSLEGPENGVYIRGRTTDKIIELPEYWTKLVDPESITVQLTPIGNHQKLFVQKIKNNSVYIENDSLTCETLDCFYYIMAERIDIDKLEVEI